MKFKISDSESEFYEGQVFSNYSEAVEALISFHEGDWKDEIFRDLRDWVSCYRTDREQLDALLEYGQWELEYLQDVTN